MKRTTAIDEVYLKESNIGIARYRELLNDYQSTDERITERLEYLESLCRNVIRVELEKYRTDAKLY